MEALTQSIAQATSSSILAQASTSSKQALLAAAKSLITTLESPEERVCRLCWYDMYKLGVIRTAVDCHLFIELNKAGGSAMSTVKLAESTKVDSRLLGRLLRVLAVDGWVEEVGVGSFAANRCTAVMADSNFAGLYENVFDLALPTVHAVPRFLKETKYADPHDEATAFKLGHRTDLAYFDYINQPGNRRFLDSFNKHMVAKNLLRRRWFEVVPLSEVLGDVADPASTLLVDIGGGVGHDLIALHEAHPELKGALLLQDLPGSIEKAKSSLPEAIDAQAYDFFTPQPIVGAKNYYLHMVLHDWPDNQCQEILKNQTSALKKGYSKILINEFVIPNKGAGWNETGMDMIMLGQHASTERTESEWKKLLESVGLRMSKIWDCAGQPEKIIEAELA